MLVRTWNLFHGKTVPPGRTTFLEEMVRLAVADRPDVLLLQELPLWTFPALEGWSGMQAFTQTAAPALLGARLGGEITRLNPAFFRSAVSGQGNAILLDSSLEPFDYHALVLNPRDVRREQAHTLGLGVAERLAWGKERRVLQAVRVARPGGEKVLTGNLHATYHARDRRLAEAEVRRAADFLLALTQPGEVEVLGGDFNLSADSDAIRFLRDQGFSEPGDGVDHVLVRGAAVSRPDRWRDERRRIGDALVSDHAPVEVRIS